MTRQAGQDQHSFEWVADHRLGLAAALLVASRLSGSVFDVLPEPTRPVDQRSAYEIQRCAHLVLEQSGFGRLAGWKIGCTTPVMQAYLGIASPCAGGMFQANVWRQHHYFAPAHPRRRLGVECELAVRIRSDLRGGPGPYDETDVVASIGGCMAAIEVVEDRYTDFAALGTETLIADDFFHHSCVLGEEQGAFDPKELVNTSATMSVNGEVVGGGSGADIMGEPLSVLAWLANHGVRFGQPLLAGDVVLLGSLVQTHWVKAGDTVQVVNHDLGDVGAEFLIEGRLR